MNKDKINYLDTKGFECPIPVLKAEKFIKKFKKGSIVVVESDDLLSKFDFENFCKEKKYKILSMKISKKIINIKFII